MSPMACLNQSYILSFSLVFHENPSHSASAVFSTSKNNGQVSVHMYHTECAFGSVEDAEV